MAHSVANIANRREPEKPPETEKPQVVVEPPPERNNWALHLLGLGGALAICYFAEEPLVVILVSILIAFVLAPVADLFERLRLPRSVSAGLSVLLLLILIGGVGYVGYNQVSNFFDELPKHSSEIRHDLAKLTGKAQKLEALNPTQEKGAVKVRETTNWTDLLSRGFGSITQVVLAGSFVPFLVFFMLTWVEHARRATMGLFAVENRRAAYKTIGLISGMIRNFMLGNLLIGLIMSGVSTVVFGILGISFFYFAGFISGFLSLIPYFGVALALLPPIFLGIGHLTLSKVIWIIVTVFSLHIFSINVLYPKFLGGRLRLNPLTVTLALLIWGWLWGAAGLVLAIPVTGGMKIVFDHIETLKPFGAWMGGEQQEAPKENGG
ncbi:MAG TPA: AI-2E family transporter [Terriglobales bacterium]|nr:AI-2E family transporter [Terriglobales bacterium]